MLQSQWGPMYRRSRQTPPGWSLAVALRCSGIIMSVHSLVLSAWMRCRPHLRAPSAVPCMMILQWLLCRMMWPNHDIVQCLIVERRGSCSSTRLFTSFLTQSLVFLLLVGDAKELSQAFARERLDTLSWLTQELFFYIMVNSLLFLHMTNEQHNYLCACSNHLILFPKRTSN